MMRDDMSKLSVERLRLIQLIAYLELWYEWINNTFIFVSIFVTYKNKKEIGAEIRYTNGYHFDLEFILFHT